MQWIRPNVFVLAMMCVSLCACGDDDDVVFAGEASDPDVDFTSYETFAFAQVADGGTLNLPENVAANLRQVNDALRDQLEDVGLEEAEVGEVPDLIAFSLESTNERTEVSWDCVPAYWYGDWGYDWDPCAYARPYYDSYEAGTFLVGLNDPDLEQVVFAGVAQIELDDDDDNEDAIEDALHDIFDDYPREQTGSD